MIRALHIPAKVDWEAKKLPGSFWLSEPLPDRTRHFWFFTPDGSGQKQVITVGHGFKPAISPSWEWNGNLLSPTLSPSVNIKGLWHGWLRNGYWEAV